MRQGPHDEQRQRWTEGLIRELGETIVGALGDDDVVEVLLNPDGRIWLDSRTEGMYDSGSRLLPQEADDRVAPAKDGGERMTIHDSKILFTAA